MEKELEIDFTTYKNPDIKAGDTVESLVDQTVHIVKETKTAIELWGGGNDKGYGLIYPDDYMLISFEDSPALYNHPSFYKKNNGNLD